MALGIGALLIDVELGEDAIALFELVGHGGNRRCRPGTLSLDLTKLARRGGSLARASDPPPGIVVIWRGLARLTDIELGADIAAARFVGNAATAQVAGGIEQRPRVWIIGSDPRTSPEKSQNDETNLAALSGE